MWGYEYPGDVRTVDVHIRRLREEDRSKSERAKIRTYKMGWVIIFAIKEKAFGYFKGVCRHVFLSFYSGWNDTDFSDGVCDSKIMYADGFSEALHDTESVSAARRPDQSERVCTGNESTQVDKQMRQLANLYNGRLIVVNSNFRIIRDTFEIDEDREYLRGGA